MNPEVFREMAQVQETHWWFVARRKVLARFIAGMSLRADAKILELGCGPGGNLAMLNQFGKLDAMECDNAACEVANSLSICQVKQGCLPDNVPYTHASYELICMLDVLEHIEADALALQSAAQLLKPTGRLLITVPAYPWLWSSHDEAHHHHRRYTRHTLSKVAELAGLRVERIGYFNSLLFPAILTARLLAKLTGRTPASDAAQPPPPINWVLKHIFQIERHIVPFRLFPFGTSVLAVLTPSE